MAQVLYEYYDLYNRGLVNFGGTLATGLVDVNPGAAAVRPVTMAARITPYLRYYATRRPLDDHGVVPLVLVVFDDDLAAVTSCWRRSCSRRAAAWPTQGAGTSQDGRDGCGLAPYFNRRATKENAGDNMARFCGRDPR